MQGGRRLRLAVGSIEAAGGLISSITLRCGRVAGRPIPRFGRVVRQRNMVGSRQCCVRPLQTRDGEVRANGYTPLSVDDDVEEDEEEDEDPRHETGDDAKGGGKEVREELGCACLLPCPAILPCQRGSKKNGPRQCQCQCHRHRHRHVSVVADRPFTHCLDCLCKRGIRHGLDGPMVQFRSSKGQSDRKGEALSNRVT